MLVNDKEMRKATLYAKLIHRLMTEGGTYNELVDFTGLSYHTVIRYIKALRQYKAPHDPRSVMVPVVGWRENESDGVARLRVFKMGFGRDVKQPRIDAAERQRRYRSNKLKRHLGLQNSVFDQSPRHSVN